MCGIAWFIEKSEGSKESAKARLLKMNTSIRHRGPDDSWEGVFESGDCTVWFGHVRLSIVDLSSAGHQPMRYSKAHGASSQTHHPEKPWDVATVFNGEIYNFAELKTELESKGYVFTTHGDTEVILASYLEWGNDCVYKFNGFWAFAIFDAKARTVFCSRDRFGKKPFYYHVSKAGGLAFCSEIKGLLTLGISQETDPEAIDFYLTTGFIPAPWSVYRSVRKLESGHSATYDLATGKFETFRYYELPKYQPTYDREALVKEGRALLKDATRIRMFADVPVGAFLSGGLDSSSVVAEMTKFVKKENLHTFSIGFEGKYDETPYINVVKDAFGTNHHHEYFKREHFEAMLGEIPHFYDEPFGDYSCFPTMFVSRLAREHVTVSLSGDGGDEVFWGYAMHQVAAQMSVIRKIPRPIRNLLSKIIPRTKNEYSLFSKLNEAFRVSVLPLETFYAEAGSKSLPKPDVFKQWSAEKLAYCLKKSDGNFTQAMIDYDLLFNTLWDNFLTKTDRASMSCALEIRSPFLDHRFVEFARKIPVEWKVDFRRTKILMREIIRGIVPEEIVRRGKQGFEPPVKEWIGTYEETMTSGLVGLRKSKFINEKWGIFFQESVLKKNSPIFTPQKIRLLLLILWHKTWMPHMDSKYKKT
jgi:asparagine synthase (glutamine-hydrolysing)